MLNKLLRLSVSQNNVTVFKKYLTLKIIRHYSSVVNDPISLSIPVRVHNTVSKSYENKHAHSVMYNLPDYNNTLVKRKLQVIDTYNKEEQDIETLLNKHWRTETATKIVEAFIQACSYCRKNNIPLSDKRFDKLVDGLMDKCEHVTDEELSDLLICIREYPAPETVTNHNFNDIWSALDDICVLRHMKWSKDKLLTFADHWYLLGLARHSDYVKVTIRRLARKVRHLSPAHLVHCFFLINMCRKPWEMFEFECQLEKHVDKLTLDELGIVSMSFFKTETPIKGTFILAKILEKLLAETKTVNEITLSAILKVVRYSPHLPLVDLLQQVLVKLEDEIDRLSILCCIHIALTGTNAQFFNPTIMTKISEKILGYIHTARLKDLERLTFALTLYDFNPPTSKPIYNEILKELYIPERKVEIEKHPRCLSCCIHYLGLQQIYPYDLINKVLDKNFLKFAYGQNQLKIGREILFIDSSLTLDCPDYKGNRIDDKLKHRLTRWTVDWIPNRDKKMSAGDKLLLDVADMLTIALGGKQYVNIDHILPHFQRPDIIFCKDLQGNPIKISHIQKRSIEEFMYPKDDNKWYAIIAASWNSYIRGTSTPTGILATKIRQLQKIGYITIMIPWHEFAHKSNQQKLEYVNNIIR